MDAIKNQLGVSDDYVVDLPLKFRDAFKVRDNSLGENNRQAKYKSQQPEGGGSGKKDSAFISWVWRSELKKTLKEKKSLFFLS